MSKRLRGGERIDRPIFAVLMLSLFTACEDSDAPQPIGPEPIGMEIVDTIDGSTNVLHYGSSDPVAMTVSGAGGTLKQYLVERNSNGELERLSGVRFFSAEAPDEVDEVVFSREGLPEEVKIASGSRVRFHFSGTQVMVSVVLPDGEIEATTFAMPDQSSGPNLTASRAPSGYSRSAAAASVPRAAVASVSGFASGSIVVNGQDGVVHDAKVSVEVRRPTFDFYTPVSVAAGEGGYHFAIPTDATLFDETSAGKICDKLLDKTSDACAFLGTPIEGEMFLDALQASCVYLAKPPAVAACVAAVTLLKAACDFPEAACDAAAVAYDWGAKTAATRTLRGWVTRGSCRSMIPSRDISGVVSGAVLPEIAATTPCGPDASVTVSLSGPAEAVAGSSDLMHFSAFALSEGGSGAQIGSITVAGGSEMSSCVSSGIGSETTASIDCFASIPNTPGSVTYTAVATAGSATGSDTVIVAIKPDPRRFAVARRGGGIVRDTVKFGIEQSEQFQLVLEDGTPAENIDYSQVSVSRIGGGLDVEFTPGQNEFALLLSRKEFPWTTARFRVVYQEQPVQDVIVHLPPGPPPVLGEVVAVCEPGRSSVIVEASYEVPAGGLFNIGGSYFGGYGPHAYPVALFFQSEGTWSHASNSYDVYQFEGERYEGKLLIAFRGGAGTCPFDGYIHPIPWFEGWKLFLTDEFGQNSNEVTFQLYHHSSQPQ